MWQCSQCGESIQDNLDKCQHCGRHRDGVLLAEIVEVTDEPLPTGAASELPQLGRTIGDELTPGRPLTQEGLAAVLLRFMGLCIMAYAIGSAVDSITYLLQYSAERHRLESVLISYYVRHLLRPGVEFAIGIYFLVGGQWVYDKILTPIRRSFPDDGFPESVENGLWRTWTSADGVYTQQAKFLQVTGGTVELLKEDGSTITVDRSKLSENDWNWVTTHRDGKE